MITAVVLSKNSGRTIAKTLQSLLWCDARIVVDDFSIDKTTIIAAKYKAKIVSHHLNNNFAAQRNFGLSQVREPASTRSRSSTRGGWVLFVDSDEVVSKELQKEIRGAVKNDLISGYYMKRQDRMFGSILTHGETGRVRLLRLAKRSAGAWQRPVHEIWNVKGSTSVLQNPLHHFPHPNVAQFLDNINRYSTLNAEYLYAQNVRSSLFQIVMYPTAKFLVNYLWFGGFLDGTAGIIVALMMSFHSFLTRAKLYTHSAHNV